MPFAKAVEVFDAIDRVVATNDDADLITQIFEHDVSDAIASEMDQQSADANFDEARSRLLPARRAWILSLDANDMVAGEGVNGYFGNREDDSLAAIPAFRFFGIHDHADALDRAISQLPRNSDGSIDWGRAPDRSNEDVKAAYELLSSGDNHARACYALHHPELFFTHQLDAFAPWKK